MICHYMCMCTYYVVLCVLSRRCQICTFQGNDDNQVELHKFIHKSLDIYI